MFANWYAELNLFSLATFLPVSVGEVHGPYMAEWGCEHWLTVRSDIGSTYLSNYQERRHNSNFRKRPWQLQPK